MSNMASYKVLTSLENTMTVCYSKIQIGSLAHLTSHPITTDFREGPLALQPRGWGKKATPNRRSYKLQQNMKSSSIIILIQLNPR